MSEPAVLLLVKLVRGSARNRAFVVVCILRKGYKINFICVKHIITFVWKHHFRIWEYWMILDVFIFFHMFFKIYKDLWYKAKCIYVHHLYENIISLSHELEAYKNRFYIVVRNSKNFKQFTQLSKSMWKLQIVEWFRSWMRAARLQKVKGGLQTNDPAHVIYD